MTGIGTLVNAATIIAGCAIGLFLRKGFPDRVKSIITDGLGIAVIFIGISGTLSGIFRVKPGGLLDRADILMLIISIVIGSIIGELLRIDKGFDAVGEYAKRKLSKNGDSHFTEGFIGASILFCVGAMAVVGSIEDGLMGNPATLFAKSFLDGIASIIFASAYGAGVMLSAVTVLAYQGAITIGATFLKPLVTEQVLLQISMTGSALIFCIGLNLLGLKKINVANMLPATFIPFFWEMGKRIFM